MSGDEPPPGAKLNKHHLYIMSLFSLSMNIVSGDALKMAVFLWCERDLWCDGKIFSCSSKYYVLSQRD